MVWALGTGRDSACCCPGQEGGKLQVAVAWEPVGPQPLGRSGLVALGRDNLSPSGEPEGLWKGRLWALQAGARLPVGPTEVAVRGVRYQRGELQEGLGGRIVPPQAPLSPNCYWDISPKHPFLQIREPGVCKPAPCSLPTQRVQS